MSKPKKPFKETGVGKFLLDKAPSIIGLVGDAILPGNVISDLIGGSKELTETDKEIALAKLRLEKSEIDGVYKAWAADSRSDSWLPRNVRPLTMVFLTVSFVIGWYFQLEELEVIKSLLMLVLGGYFGSRGLEKMLPNSKWSK